MALPASGQIDFGQIQTEFGGSNPIAMNEYGDKIGLTVNTTSSHYISQFYGLSAQTDIPTTNYVVINSSNNSTYSTRDMTAAIVYLQVQLDLRLRRQDNYVYYEVKETNSVPISLYYPVAGGSSSLSTSYVTMGRFNLGGVTAIKMNWSETSSPAGSSGNIIGSNAVGTYAASDNSWQTISNGQSIGARMTAFAVAECYQTTTSLCTVTMDVSARKSGYNDTTLGTYRHKLRAYAESNNCF